MHTQASSDRTPDVRAPGTAPSSRLVQSRLVFNAPASDDGNAANCKQWKLTTSAGTVAEKPWERVAYGWLPNPQHEATCKFFNTILPGMFQAAFSTLGEKSFTSYFRKERQVRFDEQRNMHSCQARMKTLLADRPGMLGPYLLPPSTSIPSDVRILRNGLLALRVLQEEISGHISTLKAWQGPFHEKNGRSPLPWATEQHRYFSSAIEEWHMSAQEIFQLL